jgi:hypothetical protein
LEGGIHVPYLVQWPARFLGNSTYNGLVSSLDIVSTAAAAAGIQLPADRVYDGMNIAPFLAGEQNAPDRTLFWRWFGFGTSGPQISFQPTNTEVYPGTVWAARKGNLKAVVERSASTQPPALYDLSTDIGEISNLANTDPSDLNTLANLYASWSNGLSPADWTYNTSAFVTPLVIAGDWNAYNKGDNNSPWRLNKVTAPGVNGTPDSQNWFTNTIHVAQTGGNTTPGTHSFVLVAGNSFANQWVGTTINIDGRTTLPYFHGNALGPVNNITMSAGYYSFRVVDGNIAGTSSTTISVMKTTNPPVTTSLSGRSPQDPTSLDLVTVNISLGAPKSPEERVYLRWSTNNFLTSTMTSASGSGTAYSATIPAQPDGTGVQYCAVISTANLTSLTAPGAIDSLTLACSASSFFKVGTAAQATPTPSPTVSPTPTPSATPANFPMAILGTQSAHLRGYWKCDERNGTVLSDASGNGKDLSITGNLGTNYWLGESGEQGSCFRTDGILGAAFRTDSVIPTLDSTNFTLFALFKGGADFNAGAAVALVNSRNEYTRVQIGNDKGHIKTQGRGSSRGNGLQPDPIIAGGTAFDNTWHSIAYRRNGNGFALFVDGVAYGTVTAVFAPGGTMDRTCLMHALNPGTPHATWAKGSIQHVAIWDTALSDSELAAIQSAR